MNELSEKLNNSNIDACMGFTKINHIFYADDTALVTLSLKG